MQAEASNYEASQLDKTTADDWMEAFGNMKIDDPNEELDSVHETISWDEQQEIDRYLNHQCKEMIAYLAPFEKPVGLKKGIEVMVHQKDAARWLLNQELNPSINPFYSEKKSPTGTIFWVDRFTGRKINGPYPPVKGAILADEVRFEGFSIRWFFIYSEFGSHLYCSFSFKNRWASARP